MSPPVNAVTTEAPALDLAVLRKAAEFFALVDPEATVHIAAPEVVALLDKLAAAEAALAKATALAEYWATLAPADQHYAHQLSKTLNPKGRNA